MTIINDFMSLIYPRRCEACASLLFKHELYVCNLCRINLPRSRYHCSHEHELAQAFAGRVPFEKAISFFLFEKNGRVQKLLHNIKYQGQKELAKYIGNLYAQELLKDGFAFNFDVIIPIPLHKKKFKQRGYNQSEWFAAGFAEQTKIELSTSNLIKEEETSTQTRKKKYQRWENVEGIFKLKDKEVLKGKHVLLIDDVITTGATIEAAWMALKDVEGIRVSVAAIAFAARSLG